MKKRLFCILGLILLILCGIILTSCSSEQRPRQFDGIDPERGPRAGQGMGFNMTEEGRQQMFEERQQLALDACQDKTQGDACVLESPRGQVTGTCEYMEAVLVCAFDRPMGQRE